LSTDVSEVRTASIIDNQFTRQYIPEEAENAAVGFDALTTCQPSTVWCSRKRLPAAAAQPAKVLQSCSATDYYYYIPEDNSEHHTRRRENFKSHSALHVNITFLQSSLM
jgi:hypothetical protein